MSRLASVKLPPVRQTNRRHLRLLAQPMQDLDTAGLRLLVDPLFERPLIEELPGDPRRSANAIAHLTLGHALLDLIEASCRRDRRGLGEDKAAHKQKHPGKQTPA